MTGERRRKLFRLFLGGLIFASVFIGLQYLYFSGENSAWRRVFIERITLVPAVALIDWVAPGQQAEGAGGRIVAPGVRLSLRTGCDGADAMILLVSAFAAAGLGWRRTLVGVGGGLLLVYLFNQVRIAALFFAFRYDQSWFDLLHGVVSPVLLIVVTALYFFWCIEYPEKPDAPA